VSYDQWDRMRREAQRAAATTSTEPRQGVVTAYDPQQYAVKVLILPEGVFPDDPEENGETGWIPLGTSWAGSGWGDCAPPAIGTQVHINHQESDTGTGLVQHQLFDAQRPPPQTPAGERWIIHQSGTFVKWTNQGQLLLSGKVDVNLSVGTKPTTVDLTDGTVKVTVGSTTVTVTDGNVQVNVGGATLSMSSTGIVSSVPIAAPHFYGQVN
jgi:uncharacterized protein involved in type VI secretion and phage assembly